MTQLTIRNAILRSHNEPQDIYIEDGIIRRIRIKKKTDFM